MFCGRWRAQLNEEETMKLIFEKSRPGVERDYFPPATDEETKLLDAALPAKLRRQDTPFLPEVTELDVVRHVTALARRQAGVDDLFYPLGSCTMKYNPKLNEAAAREPGFTDLHPLAPDLDAQGTLELMYELERALCEIAGMDAVTLNPAAGAHGELTGMLMVRAYHEARGERRRRVIVPTAAHGTNPATAVSCGFEAVAVPGLPGGELDLDALDKELDENVAAIMLTNPNTLGVFERRIKEIAARVHEVGGLLYYDGANLNAVAGLARPGDMGFDVVHLNLHKTFATPHGCGGPGAGPVGVKEKLRPFLPAPYVKKTAAGFVLAEDRPQSIGRVGGFQGNVGVLVRAFAYLLRLGGAGVPEVARNAVLNAAYLRARLREYYKDAVPGPTLHEFVVSPSEEMLNNGVSALHAAKRLIDFGFHPPTVYFPLVVPEAMMIEPTETENKATLDAFVEALTRIAREAVEEPDLVKSAPHETPVTRVDETLAAKKPDLAALPGS